MKENENWKEMETEEAKKAAKKLWSKKHEWSEKCPNTKDKKGKRGGE